MKKQNTIKKLSLNKVSIMNLDSLDNVKGGIETRTGCPSEDPCPSQYVGCKTTTIESKVWSNCTGAGGWATGAGEQCNIQWL